MPAYIIRKMNGDYAPGIIRGDSEGRARELLVDIDDIDELIEMPDEVASAMGVPDAEGYDSMALDRWLRTPANLLGEPMDGSV